MAATTIEVVESADAGQLSEKTQQQRIQELAYRFWMERGCPDGADQEDWYRAEKIILNPDE